MLKTLVSVALIVLAVSIFVSPALAADTATVNSIAAKVMCQCGCGKTVLNCDDQGCTTREEMLSTIRQGLDNGRSENQIIQTFVARYGEKVLVEPPKQGFNLVVWVTPFAALVFGAGLVFVMARQWVNRSKTLPTAPAGGSAEADPKEDKYRRRLEKELKDFEEKGFR
ncbi:MAG: cytochrome c-type biogenesis protein CcmH [Dehalococcoidia bacterium]|nr:cytochrome c-type biogenesis protein CcmH [Dehalococcoidia bacterium]